MEVKCLVLLFRILQSIERTQVSRPITVFFSDLRFLRLKIGMVTVPPLTYDLNLVVVLLGQTVDP